MIVKTYDRQTAKFLAVVGENMPKISGDVMQGWIQNPKAMQKALSNAFCPPEATTPRFNVWKIIKLGGDLKTADDFCCALRDDRFSIRNWVLDTIRNPAFTVVAEETEVNLVKVAVGELGFKNGARREQIYRRAEELGLELFPSEVGPQLRLQYQDQPDKEQLLVAMESINDSCGFPGVFEVERDGSKLWLGKSWGRPDHFWNANSKWIFLLPQE